MTVRRDDAAAKGFVVWVCEGATGIRFAEPITQAMWLPKRLLSDERDISESAVFNAEVQMGGDTALLVTRVAEEFQPVSRTLEMVAQQLSVETLVIRRHSIELQELHYLSRVTKELAVVVGTRDQVGQV